MRHIRPIFLFLVVTFSGYSISAQTNSFQKAMTDTLQYWFAHEKYQEITDWVNVLNSDTLNASILYLTGLSYFVQGNDKKAFTYLDKSIVKDPYRASPYYYVGLIYSMQSKNQLAIKYYRAALRIDPKNPEYNLAMANSLFETGALDSAYNQLAAILNEPDLPAAVFIRMADIQLAKGNDQKALDHYYDCLQRADLRSEYYNDCLYNIGYFEYKAGNYADADLALSTLVSDYPDDYLGAELLIKTLFAREEYYRASNQITRLYEAHKNGKLPESMKDRYQLDEFKWEGNSVLVYENFADLDDKPISKQIFYVLDSLGEVQFTVQTEYDPTMQTMGKVLYLTKTKDGQKYTYFNETVDPKHVVYPQLKRTVIKIMEDKIEPTSIKPAN